MKSSDPKNPLAVFAGIGFEIVALIFVAVFFGSKVDKSFGLQGIATISLIILVTLGWMVHVFFLLKKLNGK